MPNPIYDHALAYGSGHIENYDFKTQDGFINFKNSINPPDRISGWKIHLSVAADDVARATDLFLLTYQKFAGKLFKVATPETAADFADPEIAGCQAGKIFVLYDCGEDNWPQIIAVIEQAFENAGIKPGVPVIESRPILGSVYAYYRCDRGPDGEYVETEDAKILNPSCPHNPYNFVDPFENFHLLPQPGLSQQFRSAWSRQNGNRALAINAQLVTPRPVSAQQPSSEWRARLSK
jgi:hypothetical protein